MSTTIYLKKDLNSGSGLGAYYYASGFRPLGVQHLADTNTTAGGTLIQCTYVAGDPEILAWVSPPLAAAVTIAGAISVQISGKQSADTVNAQLRFQLYKFSGGVEAGSPFSAASMGAELTTATTRYNWSDSAPTSTDFAVGDRIVIKYFIANFGTMAVGTAEIVYGDNDSAQAGDAFVTFTENITFTQEPEYQQGGNTLTNPYTLGGASLAHNSILVLIAVTHGAVIASVTDGTNSYTQIETAVAGSNNFDIYAYIAKDIAAGGPYSISVAMTSGTWINTGVVEYYGITTNPVDQHSGAGGSSNTFDSGSKTTLYANEVIAGLAAENSGLNFTAGSGFIVRFPLHLVNDQNYWEDKFVTSAGSYKADGTLASSDTWAAMMVTLISSNQPAVAGDTVSITGKYQLR